jgi:hypothetical protein
VIEIRIHEAFPPPDISPGPPQHDDILAQLLFRAGGKARPKQIGADVLVAQHLGDLGQELAGADLALVFIGAAIISLPPRAGNAGSAIKRRLNYGRSVRMPV